MALASAALIAPRLSSILLLFAGFSPAEAERAPPVVESAPQIINAVSDASARFHSDEVGLLQLPPSSVNARKGVDGSGGSVAHVEFDAGALKRICDAYSNFCRENGHPLRNATFRFDSGQLIVAAEAFIPIVNQWQPLDIALAPGPPAFFQLYSVRINGVAWNVPENALGMELRDLESALNRLLRGLTMTVAGGDYRLSRLAIEQAKLVAVFTGD